MVKRDNKENINGRQIDKRSILIMTRDLHHKLLRQHNHKESCLDDKLLRQYFWKHVQGRSPNTLGEFYKQVESFKFVEESLIDNKKAGSRGATKVKNGKRKDRSPRPNYRRERKVHQVEGRDLSPSSNYEKDSITYTPLAASIEYIYEVNKGKCIFRRPAPLIAWQTKDKKRFCEYHESVRHDTHKCQHLTDEIEELIKEGNLGKWIVKKVMTCRGDLPVNREGLGHAREREEKEKSDDVKFVKLGSIHAIFGEPHCVGYTNGVMNRYTREKRGPILTDVNRLEERPPKMFRGETRDITFTEDDTKWVHHPHNDALVVKVCIGAMNVYRVFIDNRCSVNILYHDSYKKMGFLEKDMECENIYIYGLDGEAVKVKGTVRLPITIGENLLSTIQIIQDHESSHNTLLGRPLLKDMRVITSIHHLSIKFSTPNSVGCV
ncbi:uncharacterized protein LOC141660086 [Apium graveolens]|uniref:uncharacterized protein LOC141660086 n=1 Tax=Apium graveolens TaxID=4045 RepID=UPI003D7A2A8E